MYNHKINHFYLLNIFLVFFIFIWNFLYINFLLLVFLYLYDIITLVRYKESTELSKCFSKQGVKVIIKF